MEIEVRGRSFQLLWQKAIWWQEKNRLIISDLHVGKVEHFRNSGIGLPPSAGSLTIDRLSALIEQYHPAEVIFLGDLFHSRANSAVENFRRSITEKYNCSFKLVIGNHDILPLTMYDNLKIEVSEDIIVDGICLAHEIPEDTAEELFYMGGHVHPAVRISGKGRQSETLSCFCISERGLLLPAFGYFTGRHVVSPQPGTRVIAIAGTTLFDIPLAVTG